MRSLVLIAVTAFGMAANAALDESLKQEADRAIARGLDYLGQKQEANGSWHNHPAITGLATLAFARAPGGLTPEYEKRVEGGLKFILACVKPDGSIYGGPPADPYPNYSTAICVTTLALAGKPEHRPVIAKAREFLLHSQFDETEDIGKNDPSYGGIGYGRRKRPDLSNTAFALEALHVTEQIQALKASETEQQPRLHWDKALAFLAQCQNLESVNPKAPKDADDAGGFYYMPGESFAGSSTNATGDLSLRSYGSMTYQGFKSLLYAGLQKDDKRTQAALDWIRRHWTFAENPGMGKEGHFYYLHAMAKALDAYGEPTIRDDKGTAHNWRNELVRALLNMQREGSFWINDAGRWQESDPVLVTSYAVLTLQVARGK